MSLTKLRTSYIANYNVPGRIVTVPYRKRVTMSRQKTTKTKLNKKLLTATVACVAAAAVGVTGLAHVLQPVEVYAKESFTGTKQIVDTHTDENEPFLILDIVPSYATYAWQTTVSSDTTTEGGTEAGESNGGESTEIGGTGESSGEGATGETTTTVELEFSTGTLSYLVKGQSVMEKEYAEVYQKYPSQLRKYADRKAFVDAVWKSETDVAEWGFRYEEAYAGTRKDLESADSISEKGWIKLIEPQTLDVGDQEGATAHNGRMRGYYLKYGSSEGSSTGTIPGESGASGETTADKTGYDYEKVGTWDDREFENLKDAVYTFDSESGTYRLTFNPIDASAASSGNAISGYLVASATPLTSENISTIYSNTTGVYIYDKDSDSYYYWGTLSDYYNKFGGQSDASSENSDNTKTDQNQNEQKTGDEEDSEADGADQTGEKDQADETNTGTDNNGQTGSNITTGTDSDSQTDSDTTTAGTDNSQTGSDTTTGTDSASQTDTTTTEIDNSQTNNDTTIGTDNNTSTNSTTDNTSAASTDTNSNNGESVLGVYRSQSIVVSASVTNGSTANSNAANDSTTNSSTANDSTTNDNTANNDTDTTISADTSASDEQSVYYIVTFEYYEKITDPSQKVYAIGSAEQITEDGDENAKPYDAYTLKAAGTAGANGEDGADNDEYGIAPMNLEEGVITTGTDENDPEAIFLYVGEGNGAYKLIDESEVSDDYKKDNKPVLMEVRNAPTYFRYTGGNDWLKEYVFHSLKDGDNANENFRLEVKTIRADELTMELIDKADLVYLEDGTAPFLNVTGTSDETAETEPSTSTSTATLHRIDKSNETVTDEETKPPFGMTKENVYALAHRVVNDLLPVMADESVTENTDLNGSNYQALVKLLLKKDPEGYVGEARTDTDWLIKNLDNGAYPDQTVNNKHYVNRNIYMIHSTKPLVDGDFNDRFGDESANNGFAEVLQLIRSENMLLAEDEQIPEVVSKARAIEYIINYAVGLVVGYTDLQILELQPSSNDSADLYGRTESGTTTLYFKRSETGAKEKQVLRSSSEMKVDVTVKSASAFNSEWTDLNGTYNLIFIGLDGQKLNHSSDLWDTAVYNDTALEHKLYHTGDQASGLEERYDGIDITAGKKQALLDFLKSGYPVLVENEFFTGKTAKGAAESDINTKYVAADTQMYQFLKEALSTYQDQIYTISDVRNNVLFRAQTALDRPEISISEEAGGMLTSQKADNGEYYYTIPYSVRSRFGENYGSEYTVECYLDINGDGSFSVNEKISDPIIEQPQIRAVNNGGSVSVTFTEEPGSRAMSYLLRVYDNTNSYLRSEAQGTLQFTGATKETIRILQLGSQDETSLAYLYEQEDSVLGYYLNQAEGILNAHFEIATKSVNAAGEADATSLPALLAKDPDYLDQYDILLLGFGNGGNTSLPDTVQTAVEKYIKDGRSVLISKQGTLAESNRLGLAAELLGQTDGKTYTKLGRDSSKELFRYAGLSADMFTERADLSAEGINAGSVYIYPNAVGKTGSFASDTKLMAGDYRLDLTNDLTKTEDTYVTPWFVLTGSESSTGAYNVSKHDGANNYYLYSKGNVVCIGQQDYAQYTYQADNEENPIGTGLWESQLFVNAMVLAYNAGIHDLKVDIVAGFGETAAPVESVSVPFDAEIVQEGSTKSGLLDETVDVYFRYRNSNLAITKDVKVNFYYEDESGATQLATGDGIVKVTKFEIESGIWTVKEHEEIAAEPSKLKQDEVYRIKAPVLALANHAAATNARIYVEVLSDLQRPDGTKTVRGIDSVSLNRVQLFMLE